MAKLVTHDNNQVKKQACTTLSKCLKQEKHQILAKESGFLGSVANQLNSTDLTVVASTAALASSLAKNDSNLGDLLKLGAFDSLVRHSQGEDKESRREAVGALASFCGNG